MFLKSQRVENQATRRNCSFVISNSQRHKRDGEYERYVNIFVFIYSCEVDFISKEISRARPEYMNTPPPK